MEAHCAGHISLERLCRCSTLSRSTLLRAFTRERPHSLLAKRFSAECVDLTVVNFPSLTQSCRTYDEFISKMSACPEEELSYTGIAACGRKRRSTSLRETRLCCPLVWAFAGYYFMGLPCDKIFQQIFAFWY